MIACNFILVHIFVVMFYVFMYTLYIRNSFVTHLLILRNVLDVLVVENTATSRLPRARDSRLPTVPTCTICRMVACMHT
jgi:hypothetical protein